MIRVQGVGEAPVSYHVSSIVQATSGTQNHPSHWSPQKSCSAQVDHSQNQTLLGVQIKVEVDEAQVQMIPDKAQVPTKPDKSPDTNDSRQSQARVLRDPQKPISLARGPARRDPRAGHITG